MRMPARSSTKHVRTSPQTGTSGSLLPNLRRPTGTHKWWRRSSTEPSLHCGPMAWRSTVSSGSRLGPVTPLSPNHLPQGHQPHHGVHFHPASCWGILGVSMSVLEGTIVFQAPVGQLCLLQACRGVKQQWKVPPLPVPSQQIQTALQECMESLGQEWLVGVCAPHHHQSQSVLSVDFRPHLCCALPLPGPSAATVTSPVAAAGRVLVTGVPMHGSAAASVVTGSLNLPLA